jgi:hypothetical protein
MTRTIPFVLALLTLGGAFPVSASSSSSLRGAVSLGRAPFPGVEIQASSSSIRQFGETTTDASGRYMIEGLPPGRYTVWAEATGHGCIVVAGIVVPPKSEKVQNFRFAKGKIYPGCELPSREKHSK